jgi:hypothetical protein
MWALWIVTAKAALWPLHADASILEYSDTRGSLAEIDK